MRLLPLLAAALLALPLPAAAAGDAERKSPETSHYYSLYTGNFPEAYDTIARRMTDASADPALRFILLMQRVRAQQIARLSGQPSPAESKDLATLSADAAKMPAALQGEARLVALVSTYYRRLTEVEKGDFMSLQPGFNAAAKQIADPCHKADAQFYSALMTQMSEKVLESAAGLEQARDTAAVAGCELQLSYALRHLAVVAEQQGDLEKAALLAQKSLDLRVNIRFDVFLPFSLLHSADLAHKRGDVKGARKLRKDALLIAKRLKLPTQIGAARAAVDSEK